MGNDPAGGAPPARRGWQPDPHQHHPLRRTPTLTIGIAGGGAGQPPTSMLGCTNPHQHYHGGLESPPSCHLQERPPSASPTGQPPPQQQQQQRWEAGQTPSSITRELHTHPFPLPHTMAGWADTPHQHHSGGGGQTPAPISLLGWSVIPPITLLGVD